MSWYTLFFFLFYLELKNNSNNNNSPNGFRMNHNMVLYFATGVTISICVLVIGLFGCVTITINTPLPAYQLLVYSNGLFFSSSSSLLLFCSFSFPLPSPTRSLQALFLLRIYLLCQGTTRPSWLFFFILSVSLALSLFFSLFISISSSSSSYFLFLYIFLYASSRSLLFCPPNEENTYTTLDRLYTYLLFSKASKRYL